METGTPETASRVPVADCTRPSVVRAWAREYGVEPSRSLGQNFLIDGNIRDIILDACDIHPCEGFLEIGPGLGALTAGLLARGARVVALEKDRRLLPPLRDHLHAYPGFTLRHGDALTDAVPLLADEHLVKVVSNLPYNPGSRILLDLVMAEHAPARLVVTVQAEVAERITARPGTKNFSLLSLWCQTFFTAVCVKRVRPSCFWPRPRVQSAVVQMEARNGAALQRDAVPYFQRFTKLAFRYPRKQMGHILSLLGVDSGLTDSYSDDMLGPAWQRRRPADLSVAAWCSLAAYLRQADVQFAVDGQHKE